MVIEQIGQRKSTCLLATNRHRQSLCQVLLITENRKQMLLSITEISSFGNHPASQNFIFISYCEQETYTDTLSGSGIKFLLLGRYYLICHWIEKYQFHSTRQIFTGQITNRSSHGSVISYPDKPR